MSHRKPRVTKNGTEPTAGAFSFDDDERVTSHAATLWLNDAYSCGVYTLKIKTVDFADSPQSTTLHLRWLESSEAGTVEDEVRVPIAGGARGVRALIGLLDRVASTAEASGHLVPVPPRQKLAQAG